MKSYETNGNAYSFRQRGTLSNHITYVESCTFYTLMRLLHWKKIQNGNTIWYFQTTYVLVNFDVVIDTLVT